MDDTTHGGNSATIAPNQESHMQDEPAPASPPARPEASDTMRLQILATEHWSLLATRSMTWNEMFTRTGMFLTVLSAAVVALALVAQATEFGSNFRVFALLVLPVVLFLGIGTYIRLGDARTEDVWHVIGMNRLRHAYLELAPDLEPYFITSQYDDIAGMMLTYSPDAHLSPSRVLAGTPIIVGVINAVLVGVLLALVVQIIDNRASVYVSFGSVAALGALVLFAGVIPYREISRIQRAYHPKFPPPVAGENDDPV
jgi:hypothetical protein